MSTPAKDVIYIDVDDEITAIIDKVTSSQSKIIALVLPKRAATLQSIVNMKLLKKAADDEKKHLVLITAEAGLLPLAAATEMYVAKNLQTKPEIPAGAGMVAAEENAEEPLMLDGVPADPDVDKSTPVGDLAGMPDDTDDTIMLDNSTPKSGKVIDPAKAVKKDKKMKVPNFNKFRLWIIVAVAALIVLGVGWYVCFKVLPKANVLIKTDSTAINTSVGLTLNTTAKSVDVEDGIAPAKTEQVQKTLTQQVAATGQRNDGQKASGTVVFSAGPCSGTLPAGISAGTGITASNMTFITQAPAMFTPVISNGKCTFQSSSSIQVIAQNPGAGYNIAPATFSVAGRADASAASSAAMSGGTDQIVKLVQQADIDSAKSKLEAQDTNAIKQQLQSELIADGLVPVPATFVATPSAITSSANAGDPGDNVTVTENITYTMMGAKQSDLQKLVANAAQDKIDTKKQSIIDYGIAKANYTNVSQEGGKATMTMQVVAVAGPDINTEEIAKQIAGKKTGDAKKIIQSYPGVTDVEISYSPFWVGSMTSNASKITVTIDEPQKKTDAN